MPQNYVPIFIFMAVIGVLLPITLLAAKLVRPDNPSKAKLMPYECGIDPIDNARGRYTVRYYIIAILFVVFDVETIFLFPWAVKFKALGVFGLVEMLIFLGILIESSGGTDPITSHGHRKGDAVRIRDLVESFQASRH